MTDAERIRRNMFGDVEFERMNALGVFDDVLECPPEEEQVRKEFQAEVDVAYQLKMFGAGQAFARQGHSGFVNYDLDRLSAEQFLAEAQQEWLKLSPELRAKFKTWEALEIASRNGELEKFLTPPLKEGVPPASS